MDKPPKIDEEHELLRERIAKDSSIQLYRQYNEPSAAELLGIHPQTLKAARLEGRVGCIRLGKRSITYFGFQIVDFLIENMQEPTRSVRDKRPRSETVPSPNRTRQSVQSAPDRSSSEDGADALRIARKALGRPAKD